jgi:hypothetical protein
MTINLLGLLEHNSSLNNFCGKMIRKYCMPEARPCIREIGHGGQRHTPDLTGLQINSFFVLERATDRINHLGYHITYWKVRDKFGFEKEVQGNALIRGDSKGIRVKGGHKYRARSEDRPEYTTVARHWRYIFNPKHPAHIRYVGMPFYDEWNPLKGGTLIKGMLWIIENLGPKPSIEWSLDIVKHELGFVPGNLRWALRDAQARNKKHRVLGQFSDEEFAVEARRRGYIKTNETV